MVVMIMTSDSLSKYLKDYNVSTIFCISKRWGFYMSIHEGIGNGLKNTEGCFVLIATR